jgi:mxaK protein
MKRRTVHAAFGAAALVFAATALFSLAALNRAERVNRAIAQANLTEADLSIPEARFAQAVAFARAGKVDDAIKAYKEQVQGKRADLRLAALYNLGNLYLRQANQEATEESTPALPLIELAKQSYRDLLRSDPGYWDARYNLERALWLAPEVEDEILDVEDIPDAEDRTMSTLPGARLELP